MIQGLIVFFPAAVFSFTQNMPTLTLQRGSILIVSRGNLFESFFKSSAADLNNRSAPRGRQRTPVSTRFEKAGMILY